MLMAGDADPRSLPRSGSTSGFATQTTQPSVADNHKLEGNAVNAPVHRIETASYSLAALSNKSNFIVFSFRSAVGDQKRVAMENVVDDGPVRFQTRNFFPFACTRAFISTIHCMLTWPNAPLSSRFGTR